MLKNYSFNLDDKNHIDIINWIKEQRKDGDLNFSGLMRKLLKDEINRKKIGKCQEN